MFGFGSVQQKSWEAMTWSWYSRAINVSRWSTHWSSARWRSREWFHIWAELQQLERSNSTPPSGWLLWQLPRNKSTTFVMRWNWGWLRAAGSRPAKNFGGGRSRFGNDHDVIYAQSTMTRPFLIWSAYRLTTSTSGLVSSSVLGVSGNMVHWLVDTVVLDY